MDEGTPGVNGHSTEQLRHDVDLTRQELGSLLGQLDRRRRELLDWRLQLSRHPAAASVTIALLFLALTGTLTLLASRVRRRARPSAKLRRLRWALGRVLEEPELIVRGESSLASKMLAEAGTTLAGTAARNLGEAALRRWHVTKG